MNTNCWRAIFVALLVSPALFTLYDSLQSVIAQERQSQSSSNTNKTCEECCDSCRERFYSQCSLSPVMVDSFGVLNHETEMARLDNFAQQINGSPGTDAYVVVYGGRVNKNGELDQRAKRIKDYLLDFKKIDPSRMIFVTGGFREKFTFEMWLSPVRNSYPPLTTTISPEKVTFKGKMEALNAL